MVLHSFTELNRVYRESNRLLAVMSRVAPGSFSFYATAIRRGTEQEEKDDILAHCNRHNLTVKKWTIRNKRPCAMVTTR